LTAVPAIATHKFPFLWVFKIFTTQIHMFCMLGVQYRIREKEQEDSGNNFMTVHTLI